ncbi:peptide chain release factor-like protein, partial [Thermodesulfobacteriota bacterium B35]
FSLTKKDLQVEYFSGTGPGGQYRNRHRNCVRLYHPDSGARVTGQSHRNRQANLKEAFQNLLHKPAFKVWFNRKVMDALSGQSLEQRVREAMSPENLKLNVGENPAGGKSGKKHEKEEHRHSACWLPGSCRHAGLCPGHGILHLWRVQPDRPGIQHDRPDLQ